MCKECCEFHLNRKHDLIIFDFNSHETAVKIEKLVEYFNSKNNDNQIINIQKYDNDLNFSNLMENSLNFSNDNIEIKNDVELYQINCKENNSKEIVEENNPYYIYELFKIIYNDHLNYPNYSHFMNIDSIFKFLENKLSTKENTTDKENNDLNKIDIEGKDSMNIIYKNENEKIKLFGNKFIINNQEKVYIKIDNNISKIKEYLNYNNKMDEVKIEIIFLENEIDMSYMFNNCVNLKSVFGNPNFKTKIKNTSYMFYNCSSLYSLPDISQWDISELNDVNFMFYNCYSLPKFPDLSNWIVKKSNIFKNNNKAFISFSSPIYWNKTLSKIENSKPKRSFPQLKKLFGKQFVLNNKDKVIMKINGKEYELKEYIGIDEIKERKIYIIELIGIEKITNMSYMFHEVTDIPDISKWDTSNVTNMSYMFLDSKIKRLPNISGWKTNNVRNMSNMFNGCNLLKLLPDISKWNTDNVTDMSFMFNNCNSLKNLPDISNWNTFNVKNMSYMFNNCSSFNKLPDISKWNTDNVTDMSYMFNNCNLLYNLPEISNWNTYNVTNMSYMFCECKSLESLPDISKWITDNVIDMSYMFKNCISLKNIPDVSNWNTKKVINMSYMFYGCSSIKNLSYISKFNISNVFDMSYMFYGCTSLPDISKWNTDKVIDKTHMFN